MDFRRVMLFFALSLLSIYLYSQLVGRLYGRRLPVEQGPELAEGPRQPLPPPAAETHAVVEPSPKPERPVPVGKPVVVETDLFRAEWTTAGARLRSLKLKDYRERADVDSPPLELVHSETGGQLPVGVEILPVGVDDSGILYRTDISALRLTGDEVGSVVFRGSDGNGVQIDKEVHFRGNAYPIEVVVRATAPGISESDGTAALVLTNGVSGHDNGRQGGWFSGGSRRQNTWQLVVLNGSRLEQKSLASLEKGDLVFDTPVWGGFGDRYFVTVAVPDVEDGVRVVAPRRGPQQTSVVRLELPMSGTPPAARTMLYFGPKDLATLEEAAPGLKRAVDFGWFWFVALPLHWCLNALHRITGNYGIEIIIVSSLIKLLFLPLTRKSMESMRAMQKLQPEMTKIRERYKDDAQRLQKEMMELYRRHHVNPLSGCLPMLLQIPVFVGLYNTLLNAIELRHAPFGLWIQDLSAPERLTLGGVGIPMLAIAMGVSMLVQQWMAPAAGDPTQRRMMMIMPVVFTFMFVNFPSGLVLYWLVNNLLTIGQQYFVLNRTAG